MRSPKTETAVKEGTTALVVEDESLIRMLMVDALSECGYQVLEAADGWRGRKILEDDAGIELLVTDHHLPGGITGRELAELARSMQPSIRVLLVSGYPAAVVLDHRKLPGGMRLLSKPFSMATLVSAVLNLQGPPFSPERVTPLKNY